MADFAEHLLQNYMHDNDDSKKLVSSGLLNTEPTKGNIKKTLMGPNKYEPLQFDTNVRDIYCHL